MKLLRYSLQNVRLRSMEDVGECPKARLKNKARPSAEFLFEIHKTNRLNTHKTPALLKVCVLSYIHLHTLTHTLF